MQRQCKPSQAKICVNKSIITTFKINTVPYSISNTLYKVTLVCDPIYELVDTASPRLHTTHPSSLQLLRPLHPFVDTVPDHIGSRNLDASITSD